ncbi:MFS transporter [Sphingomonas koreensis]|jgi:MFS family permease|uniref:MFS transporter n=2 Tax=Sphingomonas koreensis TaxID=93064 RepID=A0AAJ4S0Z6_9SPHN|nr:MFS transporter [Sphingomonas koreensis]RSU21944.1 MFS transporter [Sphingomonas koreensis]RSU23089.1 MFS transporter [Sphingomonas koreensis]RSU31660.1 MFS transporter [Sphingomonas koreensis]RSU34802.1 MFS transporter [Sphingomonas koreensis]
MRTQHGGDAVNEEADGARKDSGAFQPLVHRNFREIWLASLMSNLALLITGVGAAWAMTLLTDSAQMVALVQSALMLPFLFLAMPAGAIADSYDRRRVAILAMGGGALSNLLLLGVALSGLLTPWLLLALCFLVGIFNTMFTPSWQSAVSEQVPAEDLPRAVALNAISFNIARSFGPALGGAIVAVIGAAAAFAASVLLYVPMIAAFWRWKRVPDTPRLPPERVAGAIVSGIQYIGHSGAMRAVIVRSFLYCAGASSVAGLLPLISKLHLQGGPLVFGLLLACYGGGAVIGGVFLQRLRSMLGHSPTENGVALTAAAIIALAFAGSLWLAAPILIFLGAVWTQALTTLNVAVQTGAPRWVSGRALAGFQATAAGGFALGSWVWGYVVEESSLTAAMIASGVALMAFSIAGRLMKSPADIPNPAAARYDPADPEIDLALTGRSGPIAIQVVHIVPEEDARGFYDIMLEIRRIRRRNGASAWSLARDIADARRWIERFHCPTWHDYLRHRTRLTAEELGLLSVIAERYGENGQLRMTRLLERPVGSVRWQADTPDRGELPATLAP